jgi:hypothetical protein
MFYLKLRRSSRIFIEKEKDVDESLYPYWPNWLVYYPQALVHSRPYQKVVAISTFLFGKHQIVTKSLIMEICNSINTLRILFIFPNTLIYLLLLEVCIKQTLVLRVLVLGLGKTPDKKSIITASANGSLLITLIILIHI